MKGVYLNEYYSDLNQVRQYVNERIDSLKQLLDERKVQLNTQLDNIEVEATNDEEKSKKLIEGLIDYEKVTIQLFGEECPHLATIKFNIESLETDSSRKKLYLQWRDEIIVDNLEWLGIIAYESNDVYARIESSWKEQISSNYQVEEKENSEQASVEKSISPAKKPPKIMKKPKVNLIGREFIKSEADPVTPATSLYDDINPPNVDHEYEYVHLSEFQTTDSDAQDVLYEPFGLSDNTSLANKDSELVYEDLSCEPEDEVFDTNCDFTSTRKRISTQSNQSIKIEYECTQQATATLNETFPKKIHIKRSKSATMGRVCTTKDYQAINEIILVDQMDEKIDYRAQDELELNKSKFKTISTEKKKWVHDLPIIEWGKRGKGIRQLNKPKGVCVSEKGQIFVAEKGNNRVQVFTPDGHHLYMFGEKSGNNAMIEPNGIWVTKHFVFVTLTSLHTIQMYTLQGGFMKKNNTFSTAQVMLNTLIHTGDICYNITWSNFKYL